MKSHIIFAIVLVVAHVAAAAQGNADVVLVESATQVAVKSMTSAVVTQKRVFTILNENGKDVANFHVSCDDNSKLTAFSGVVTDASGRELKRIKKGNLSRTEYSAELATDSYVMYYQYVPPSYPVTVTYEWTEQLSNGMLSYPVFAPQDRYRMAVKHASYHITVPSDMKVRYKAVNMPAAVTTAGPTASVAVSDLAAVDHEELGLPALARFPIVYFEPCQFQYLGTKGDLSTWKSLGAWQYGLLDGRDELTPEFKAQLHAMTDTCSSQRSKIAVIYSFLERTTRYVSIQLGIGGLQPFPATQVCRTGFGDCKGLTNYVRAMLKEVGINSFYTVIRAGDFKPLYRDFPSLGIPNHVLLCIPEPADSLWVECTNAALPLGYVHSKVAGHDALLCGPDGGQLVTLPAYPDSLHLQLSRVHLKVQADASAQVELRQTSRYAQCEDKMWLSRATEKEQRDWLLKTMKVPHGEVQKIAVTESRVPFGVPSCEVDAQLSSHSYGNSSGSRIFVPVNPMHNGYRALAQEPNRQGQVYIDMGYRDIEEVIITIPDGYKVESLPAGGDIVSAFGTFSTQVEARGNEVKVVMSLTMHSGTYPASTFGQLVDFGKQVARQYGQKLVLVATAH